MILNYLRYREKDYTNAARQKRFRQKYKPGPGSVTPLRNGGVTLRNTSQKSEVRSQKSESTKTETGGADAPSSHSRKRVSYPDDFAAWFLTYRKGTGRGTTKAEALTEYLKLAGEDRGALIDYLNTRRPG